MKNIQAEEEQVDLTYPKDFTPNTRFLQNQWNLDLMNVGEAWADGYDGTGIKISVLDTGFYHEHPDINLAGGDSVFSDEVWSIDHSGHGTHIAGIISARKETKYQGIAPGAEVYGIKIYHSRDTNEFGDVSTDVKSVIKGIQLAMKKKSDIIVISSGLDYHDEELYQIIKEAHQKEIMIIAASGNGNLSVNYPASYEEVIAVTAVDEDLNPALDIIYGEENEFSAPGVNIGGLSIPESSYSYPYIYMSGSSQATPHVASLAAIIMQKYEVRGEEARKIMQDQAINLGEPALFGNGLVFYRSDERIKENQEGISESSSEGNTEPEDEELDGNESQENEARKPSSSREAEEKEEVTEEKLSSYKKVKVTLLEDNQAVIDSDRFPTIEVGGQLDIFMRGASSLKLTEEQIADIRQRNNTLLLRQEGISWEIPPSNFVPGQAILRFYKGQPLGTEENVSSYSNIYTISIFQAQTRQGIYPGLMEVNFDLNKQEMPNPTKLVAAHFDKEAEQWAPLEKEKEKDSLSLKTKFTGAVGFFKNEEQEVIKDKVNNEVPENVFLNSPSIMIAIVLLTVIGVLFIRKKS
ncbi:MAG: S8 family serine peptidase [Atopostipes suicloacalis]|nr:S8 family serine peptidase [Atopostipes suicloacalis]